ncbi:hypothetical protein KGY14_05270 [Ameyamaea chiangmaiensis]|uniref:Uncharacterized protein n=1 Tax=Ameyamaea chiangmaiensis TaxID=442969 RepID=A0A850P3W2_9PROT|nr:hypothetical protein [Ameyamaea chiangmaiensis]MBS4074599.1 hypothetical protein [Ameyamaea chiangmaiensis]NVN39355.1 hypothetical protein [Ameyamaea chiangmaiensis]
MFRDSITTMHNDIWPGAMTDEYRANLAPAIDWSKCAARTQQQFGAPLGSYVAARASTLVAEGGAECGGSHCASGNEKPLCGDLVGCG